MREKNKKQRCMGLTQPGTLSVYGLLLLVLCDAPWCEGKVGMPAAAVLKEMRAQDDLGHTERVALRFLNKHHEGRPPRQVAYELVATYEKQGKMKEIKKLYSLLEEFSPSDDPLVSRYDCELYYRQAIADLVLLNYHAAHEGFEVVLTRFPGSHQEDNSTYWSAMSLLYQEKYPEAAAELEAYLDNLHQGTWTDSVQFNLGVCLYGMERYPEAKERFSIVIETAPHSAVYAEACGLRGNILESEGARCEAIRDYEEALSSAEKPKQATDAVFQLAAVLEKDRKGDEVVDLMNRYLSKFGEAADVAEATRWIEKAQQSWFGL